MTSAPKRARSKRLHAVAISSMPQQAVAKGIGQTLDRRAQAIVRSIGSFGKFTDAMRRQTDQIVIQSRFRFTRDETIELSSQ